jgi:hypothetical protein
MRRQAREVSVLPLAQVGTHFENEVALRKLTARIECSENRCGEPPGPRAELENLTAGRVEDLRALLRDTKSEQLRDFRRGDEIAFRPELHAAGAVITESRGIERQLHELGERQPPACGGDALPDELA